MQVIKTRDELAAIIYVEHEENRQAAAQGIIDNFGLPVYAHRFPGGGCNANECGGGWPDESCTPWNRDA